MEMCLNCGHVGWKWLVLVDEWEPGLLSIQCQNITHMLISVTERKRGYSGTQRIIGNTANIVFNLVKYFLLKMCI